MQYLPRSLGGIFQNYLPQVLPAILDGEFIITGLLDNRS